MAEGSHSLELLRSGDLREEVVAASFDQPFCGKAGVVLLWTAVFPRSVWRYKDRAYRYFYLDAGHIAAHVSLAAVALGLASCQVAAFYDEDVNKLLNIDGESEGIVYMTAVGRPSRPFRSTATDARNIAHPKE